jgi:hypothetical protein
MRICPFRIKLPVIFCEGNIVYLAYLWVNHLK